MSTAWTPNDYSNAATVGAAALCSIMMVLFKSRCTQISVLWGLWKCSREVPASEEPEPEPEPEPEAQGVNA